MALTACGPDARPEEPCNGPSFNLVVRAEDVPLPSDTHINVHYGANQDGEPYQLGGRNKPQAVRCTEDASPGGANPSTDSEAGAAGATAASGNGDVWALRCLLYTQGPARLDVSARGYEPISNFPLSLTREHHCEVDKDVVLQPLLPDAGM